MQTFLCLILQASKLNNEIVMKPITVKNRELIGRTYEEVRPQIFAIFRQACIDADTCEDLVQDVFMKVMTIDIIIPEQLKALAVRISYQKRIDYFRHRAYINNVKQENSWLMERSYNDQHTEVNDILQTEMHVVSRMSKQDARVYSLSRFEDRTADEIALELNLSKRAVECRIYRTRIMVRQEVEKVVNGTY